MNLHCKNKTTSEKHDMAFKDRGNNEFEFPDTFFHY